LNSSLSWSFSSVSEQEDEEAEQRWEDEQDGEAGVVPACRRGAGHGASYMTSAR
jgi:hypothetical protein